MYTKVEPQSFVSNSFYLPSIYLFLFFFVLLRGYTCTSPIIDSLQRGKAGREEYRAYTMVLILVGSSEVGAH